MSDAERIEVLKARVKDLLGRTPEVERLKTGKFIAKYMDYAMSPLSLVDETEEGAIEKLLAYLLAKKTDRAV